MLAKNIAGEIPESDHDQRGIRIHVAFDAAVSEDQGRPVGVNGGRLDHVCQALDRVLAEVAEAERAIADANRSFIFDPKELEKSEERLFALRAAIYLAQMGPQGLRETAELSLRKAHYAKERLTAGPRLSQAFDQPTFKEFVVRDTAGREQGGFVD